MTSYSIKTGDCLSSIARKFNVSVNDIKKANNIKNSNLIFVGQVLEIPDSNKESSFEVKGLSVEYESSKKTGEVKDASASIRTTASVEPKALQGGATVAPQSVRQTPKDGLYTYTVQSSESYTELIIKVLHIQGIANPTPQQIADMKSQFQADNPGAVKKGKNGPEYLLVGASVKLRADVGDRHNSADQIDAYKLTIKMNPEILLESKFEYDANGNPVKVVDSCGPGSYTTHENTFDSNGNLLKTVLKNASGVFEVIERTYDSNGNITNYIKKDDTGALKEEVKFTYDSSGKVIKRENIDPSDTGVFDYAYDSLGRITSVVQYFNGVKVSTDEYEYDANGNCVKRTTKNENGKVIDTREQRYSPNGELEEAIISPWNSSVDFLYDSKGRIIQIIIRDGATGEIWGITTCEYDSKGNKISTKKRRGYSWLPPNEEWMDPTYRYTKEYYKYHN